MATQIPTVCSEVVVSSGARTSSLIAPVSSPLHISILPISDALSLRLAPDHAHSAPPSATKLIRVLIPSDTENIRRTYGEYTENVTSSIEVKSRVHWSYTEGAVLYSAATVLHLVPSASAVSLF